ncbi:MAG TPA: hypothetical protein DIU37_03605 [Opitutae bacterium]|nr:hypothetical protein [Opitutae bacterium]
MLPKTIRIFILFYCVNALCAQDTDLPASSQEAEQIQEVANEADHVLSELKGMHEGSQAVTDSNAPLPLEGPIEAYPAPAAPVVPPGITETEAAPSTFNNQDNEVFERPQVNTTLDEDGDAEATLTLDDKTGDVLVFDVGENNGPDLAADGEESISVDFPDEDVRTIVRNVADLYDLNVVIPQSLVGRASIKLRKVTWRQVLDVVLEPLGFTYIEEGNILKIKSLEELHREPVSTQIFTVNYANALELRDAIGPLVVPAAGGQMQVDKRTNALIVTERPSRMSEIRQIIEKLDRQTEQVMIASKFIEINDDDARKLGLEWKSLGDYTLSAKSMSRTWERVQEMLPFDAGDKASDGTVNRDTVGGSERLKSKAHINTEKRTDNAVFSASDFEVVLRALNTMEDTKLVSNPTVVTLNNHPANIAVGERYPLPQYEFNELTGTFEISGFEYIDIGITLSVTPQVNTAGFINLDIHPEVSKTNRSVTFGGATSTEIPIIISRRTQSLVTLRDGYTIALGGLIDEEHKDTNTSVPFFGKIPVLGWAFKSRVKELKKTNLVIFVTARTVRPDGSSFEDTVDYRLLHDMKISPSEVPGYKVPEGQLQQMREINHLREDAFTKERESELETQLQALQAAAAQPNSKEKVQEDRVKRLERSGPHRF